jgi:hypothetical protein
MLGLGLARVTYGRRSIEKQYDLYGQGRSETELIRAGVDPKYARPAKRICTWCEPKDSDHVKGQAIDVDFSKYPNNSYVGVQMLCRILNVEWGGNWKVRDYGHFGLGKPYNPPAGGK